MTATPLPAALSSSDPERRSPPAGPGADRAAAALEIAEEAGRMALGFFAERSRLVVERKAAVQDFVSEADRAIEVAIRRAVAERFPDDALLGEEDGLVGGTSGFTWIVDPIDGTQSFLTGQPNWCVSIAVAAAAGTVAGVIRCPVLGETYAAVRGGGATLNGAPIRMDPDGSATTGNIAYGGTNTADPADAGRFMEALYRAGGVVFRVGSGAIMLAYVASGRLAGYFDPVIRSWDCAAGNLIVTEAGGVIDYRAPDMLSPGPLAAGARRTVDQILGFAGLPPRAE